MVGEILYAVVLDILFLAIVGFCAVRFGGRMRVGVVWKVVVELFLPLHVLIVVFIVVEVDVLLLKYTVDLKVELMLLLLLLSLTVVLSLVNYQ